MKDTLIKYRNSFIHWNYAHILKPYFFKRDPEDVHDRMIAAGRMLGSGHFSKSLGRRLTKWFFYFHHPMLGQEVAGLYFSNPIGLAAGFDKNADLVDILPSVGFGFEEVGSITGYPCPGNPKPRLWRLPKSRGLVVYYGLKSDGCQAVASRLQNSDFLKRSENIGRMILGTSVAMTNCQANLDTNTAIKDYAKAFAALADVGDYFTINISCPNAQGGQPFVAPDKLDMLFSELDKITCSKPIFIKMSPDLEAEQVDSVLKVLHGHRVHGIICTNLTKNRSNPKILDKDIPSVGGISGKPVEKLADDLLSYIYKREKDLPKEKRFVLVGCGGVFNAADAYKKIRLGASLVQLATGMIFEGPQVIGEINRGLVSLLRSDGFANISDAIGADI